MALPPSFCDGLVLVASFDVTPAPELGAVDVVSHGASKLVADGRFGNALELAADAGDDEAGAAVYFANRAGGAPVFPDAEGTLAMWVRRYDQVLPIQGARVYYRPVGALPPAALTPSGPTLAEYDTKFGLLDARPDRTRDLLTFSLPEARRYLRPNAPNHFVTAWRRGDASGPTAYLVINGGTGERFDDAGPDATDPYADASPNEAGALLVPYRGYTSAPWDYDASTSALRLSGPQVSSTLQGIVDDVAVWNRVLSLEEMEATYRSGRAIGEVCPLTK